ncbi:MAG: FkbM family methyltransferase [Pseudomonadota bacterium]
MGERLKRFVATGIKPLRWLTLSLLRLKPFDFSIKNPFSGKRFKVNSYRHKGYWYFRGDREKDTMRSLRSLVARGDTVIEVGGHIGFVTHLYSELVGQTGTVHVFEPGKNNLPYTRTNTAELENVSLHELGCSDASGVVEFYEDSISGQNNSLREDFYGVEFVADSHFSANERSVTSIEVVALGDFISKLESPPDHIKVDAEGAELKILNGLGDYLGKIPCMMVEVTYEVNAVYALMAAAGYTAYDERLSPLSPEDRITGNVFFRL